MINDGDPRSPGADWDEMQSDERGQRDAQDLSDRTVGAVVPDTQIVGNKVEIETTIDALWKKLPEIASGLISESQDLSVERNRLFQENPDSSSEHEPNWHQWGVITHTRMFEKAYRDEIPGHLKQWEVNDRATQKMAELVDGNSKDQLLNIAIILHDLGKFTERKLKSDESGHISASFKQHEAASGRIIRSPEFSQMLKTAYGLTDGQIEYIAKCAELHFELGVVRDEARKTEAGYTLAFAQSDAFKNRAKQIMGQHGDYQLEIGLLFLADSLAKTDIRIEAENDQEIDSQDAQIADILQQRELNPKLIGAVKQLPVNLAVAETYLKMWAQTEREKY